MNHAIHRGPAPPQGGGGVAVVEAGPLLPQGHCGGPRPQRAHGHPIMHIAPLLPHELPCTAPLAAADPAPLLGRLGWHVYTPYAVALAARRHEEVLGCATAQFQGSVCRITLLRSDVPTVRAALVAAVGACAEGRGCTTLLVHAALGEEGFWTAQGFTATGGLLRYSGGTCTEATWESVRPLEPRHRMPLLHLDRRATGEERTTLLLEHEHLGLVCAVEGTVRGVALPLLGEGLVLAPAAAVGMELLRWHFPLRPHVLLHAGHTLHDLLSHEGHTAEVIGTRMVRGAVPALHPTRVHAEPFGTVPLQDMGNNA